MLHYMLLNPFQPSDDLEEYHRELHRKAQLPFINKK